LIELFYKIIIYLLIVKKGCENIKIPVTAKIRIFETIEKSVEYAKMIESTGVAVIFCSLIK
jgi:tRNA-dihydrouridine synthase